MVRATLTPMFGTVQIFSVLLVGGHQGPGARCPKSGRGEEEEGLNCGKGAVLGHHLRSLGDPGPASPKPRLPEAPPQPRSPRVLCCSSGSRWGGRRWPQGHRAAAGLLPQGPTLPTTQGCSRQQPRDCQNLRYSRIGNQGTERLSKLPEITQLKSGEAAFSPRRRLSRLELVDEDKNGMDSQTIIFPTLQTFSTKENKGSLEHLPLIIPHWGLKVQALQIPTLFRRISAISAFAAPA
ncbi:uncharacterized protein LOC116666098 [Camelus ferus]|uniref:Uncharacterized protein LOC116666098 n=1 Tax=Camelus ferus TaxID=419612 RepID=A0A8B8TQF5_CAMFR|nr:uncharacterized protein LOC116666098 [Camelus ferus]